MDGMCYWDGIYIILLYIASSSLRTVQIFKGKSWTMTSMSDCTNSPEHNIWPLSGLDFYVECGIEHPPIKPRPVLEWSGKQWWLVHSHQNTPISQPKRIELYSCQYANSTTSFNRTSQRPNFFIHQHLDWKIWNEITGKRVNTYTNILN